MQKYILSYDQTCSTLFQIDAVEPSTDMQRKADCVVLTLEMPATHQAALSFSLGLENQRKNL